jgi:hypothetical protein
MAIINLETNPYFKEEMASLGFKKTKNEFIKSHKEALQEIVWGHATHGEKQTRYYSFTCMVKYPAVLEISKQINVIVHPVGTSLGTIMPIGRFVEWELRNSSSEKEIQKVISSIIKNITEYAMPYMDKLSTMSSFIEYIEKGNTVNFSYDKKMPPIIYRLLGHEDKAQKYIENTLKELTGYQRSNNLVEYKITQEYKQVTTLSSGNRGLNSYKEFVYKFNSMMRSL